MIQPLSSLRNELPAPGISIVIVSYNVREFLNACLQSVLHAAGEFKGKVEIIVFDNASKDGTLTVLKPRYPQVTWLGSDRNLGFGSGCNRGATVATQPMLLFLNPDTLVEENTFRVMWDFYAANPEMGAAGCKIVNRDGGLQLACKRSFPSPRVAALKLTGLSSLFPKSRVFGKYNLTYLDENKTHIVDAVSGSFLFLSREVFNHVHGFDEDFFMYGEDLDICYRISQLGLRNYYHPKTTVTHFKGESARTRPFRSFYNFYEAMVIFSRKHFELRALPLWMFYFGIAILAGVNLVTSRLQKWPRWFLDMALVNILLAVATTGYFRWVGVPHIYLSNPGLYLFWHLLISVVVLSSMAYMGEYARNLSNPKRTALGLIGAFLVIFAISLFLRETVFSRAVFGLTGVMSLLALSGWRLLVAQGSRFLGRIFGTATRMAIIGTNERAQKLASLITRNEIPGYDFIGYVSLQSERQPMEVRQNLIGDLLTLESVAEKIDLHQVVVVLENGAYQAALKAMSDRFGSRLQVSVLVGQPEPGQVSLVQLNFN